MCFDENPFTCQCAREGKQLRVSNFALSLVDLKRHHGSEGVNVSSDIPDGLLITDVVQYLMAAVIYQVVA